MNIDQKTKSKILEKLNGSIVRTVGTCFNTYKKRFDEKYKNAEKILINRIDDKNIKIINDKKEEIDTFSSDATYEQCMKSLVAFGFLECTNTGDYKPRNIEQSNFDILFHIFSDYKQGCDDYNKWINKYRQSRIITFLIHLGIINSDNFELLDLVRDKDDKKPKLKRLKAEISYWEKWLCSSEQIVNFVLKIVLGHEFMKKDG